MSRDLSGNYSLPPVINPVLPNTVIATSWANPTLFDIATALSDSLSRSGKGGMGAPLVMNGYKITNIGLATAPTDVPQAQQVRDQAFIWLTSVASNISGNDYVGTALLKNTPNNGAMYQFLADRTNTGPMTLAVNGGGALPILLHGAPVPPGLVLAGAVIPVVYVDLTYRLISIAPGTGTVNSVQSSDTELISVVNDTSVNIATLTPHSNVAGGMVKLDFANKVPIVLLPFTDLRYVGIVDASSGVVPSPTGVGNGDFYVVTVAGTLMLFRVSSPGGTVYTLQSTAVVVGDALIRRVGSVDPDQPDGWYYDPGVARPGVASLISHTPTVPAWGSSGASLQTWMDGVAAGLNNMIPKSGSVITGFIEMSLTPVNPTTLVNKQYVDARVSAAGGVSSFNGRQGAVTLTSPDVTGALGYTPANKAGESFTGNVSIGGKLDVNGGYIRAAGFVQYPFLNDTAPTGFGIDFNNGQSQRIGLTGNTTIFAIDNVPDGSIVRLIIYNTAFTVTWPANVNWPMGVVPNLAAGPIKQAIVVLEAVSGNFLATAAIY